jgi:alkylhydroperoxidase family enzyme
MPRLSQVRRADVSDPLIRYVFDRYAGDEREPEERPTGDLGRSAGGWHRVLAASPDVFEHVVLGLRLGPAELDLEPVTAHLVLARAGWQLQSGFVFARHLSALRALSVEAARIDSIASWQVWDGYTDGERCALAYADRLTEDAGRVPDVLFEALREHFTAKGILGITYLVGFAVTMARVSRALRLAPDDHDDPLARHALQDPAGALALEAALPPRRPT